MSLHWSFPRGTKIRIILKSGEQIIAKFIRQSEQSVLVTNQGSYSKRDVRSCNYYKPFPHELNKQS